MSSIPFVKMLANGNSLLLVDARNLPDYDWPKLACQTATPCTGVGHDGLLVVLPSEIADVRQRMFNPDGTEDMCGNGLRCTAKHLFSTGTPGNRLTIETIVGVRRVELLTTDSGEELVRAEIGRAQILPVPEAPNLAVEPNVAALLRNSFLVDMGTPHLVIPMLQEISESDWAPVSAELEVNGIPGERVTVSWFAADDSGVWHARFWERSVGETMSCGTGVAAILSVGVHLQLVESSAVIVTAGGPIRAEIDPCGSVHIAGEVTIGCVGDWVMHQASTTRSPTAS